MKKRNKPNKPFSFFALTTHTMKFMSKGLVLGEGLFALTTISIVSALLYLILVTERQRQDRFLHCHCTAAKGEGKKKLQGS